MSEAAITADALPASSYEADCRAANGLLFVAGQVGSDPVTGRLLESYGDLDPAGQELTRGFLAADSWAERLCAQTWQALRNIERILASNGANLADIVRLNLYSRRMNLLPVLNETRSRFFAPSVPPPITHVEVPELPVARAEIMIEAVSALPDTLKREEVLSRSTSQSVGNYQLASAVGPFLLAAGVIAARNDTREVIRRFADVPMVYPSAPSVMTRRHEGIVAQTEFLYGQLEKILGDRGQSFDDVARLTFYLKDMGDLEQVMAVHRRRVNGVSPPLLVDSVTELGHRDFRLEIEMVAGSGTPDGKPMFVGAMDGAGMLVPNEAAAVKLGGLAMTGGIMASSSALVHALQSDPYAEGGGIEPETDSALHELEATLAACGAALSDIVALSVRLTDARLAPYVTRRLRSALRPSPAMTLVGASELAIPNARLQLSAIAVVPA